jgi:hypothetical protein
MKKTLLVIVIFTGFMLLDKDVILTLKHEHEMSNWEKFCLVISIVSSFIAVVHIVILLAMFFPWVEKFRAWECYHFRKFTKSGEFSSYWSDNSSILSPDDTFVSGSKKLIKANFKNLISSLWTASVVIMTVWGISILTSLYLTSFLWLIRYMGV